MEHQAALLLGRLRRHEPHVGPGHCFTDCLGISGIILVPLHVRPDIGWWHQAHGMPKRLELARPMMRRRAGLDADKARRQLLEEGNDVTALQLAPDDHIAFGVNAMDLKNRLCDVETNRRDSLHGPVLRIRSPPWRPRSVALTCRWRSRPQHHFRTECIATKTAGYSISSSAMLSKPDEIVRPSALAVFMLMASSNLLGCRTGRSAGFLPSRIWPVRVPPCWYSSAELAP